MPVRLSLGFGALLLIAVPSGAAEATRPGPEWFLPDAGEVQLGGAAGEAWDLGGRRLALPPYDSPVFLRADFSFETNRVFVNYSGDISGRFIQIVATGPESSISRAWKGMVFCLLRYWLFWC